VKNWAWAGLLVGLLLVPAVVWADDFHIEITEADTLHGLDGFFSQMSVNGGLHETDFLFDEGDYVRWYAFKMSWQSTFQVLPSGTYLAPISHALVGGSWQSWMGEPVTATVVDSLLVSVPAGPFGSYVVEMRTADRALTAIVWMSRGVGMVKIWRAERGTSELTAYDVDASGASRLRPMSVGDWWDYTTVDTSTGDDGWGRIKSLFRQR